MGWLWQLVHWKFVRNRSYIPGACITYVALCAYEMVPVDDAAGALVVGATVTVE